MKPGRWHKRYSILAARQEKVRKALLDVDERGYGLVPVKWVLDLIDGKPALPIAGEPAKADELDPLTGCAPVTPPAPTSTGDLRPSQSG